MEKLLIKSINDNNLFNNNKELLCEIINDEINSRINYIEYELLELYRYIYMYIFFTDNNETELEIQYNHIKLYIEKLKNKYNYYPELFKIIYNSYPSNSVENYLYYSDKYDLYSDNEKDKIYNILSFDNILKNNIDINILKKEVLSI